MTSWKIQISQWRGRSDKDQPSWRGGGGFRDWLSGLTTKKKEKSIHSLKRASEVPGLLLLNQTTPRLQPYTPLYPLTYPTLNLKAAACFLITLMKDLHGIEMPNNPAYLPSRIYKYIYRDLERKFEWRIHWFVVLEK